MKHLQATAVEAGVDVDLFSLFNQLGEQVPVLSAVAPNGTDTIDAFEAAGGARALLSQLRPLLDLEAITVSGRTLGESLGDAVVHDADVIRPLDRPFAKHASIVVLRGSLAPESAIVRPGLQRPGQNGHFEGTAVVYDDVPVAIGGVQRGELKPGDVLVLRGCGPKGGPAMAGSASRVVFAIYAAGLESDVAFVSDGQLSGLCNKGMTIAERRPNPRSAARSRSLRTATASESTSMRARSISTCPSRNSMPGVRDGATCLCRRPLDTCPSTSEASNRCRRERYWSFPNGSRLSD